MDINEENAIVKMFEMMFRTQTKIAPKLAKAIKKMVDAFQKEGFTRAEAIEMIKSMNIKMER